MPGPRVAPDRALEHVNTLLAAFPLLTHSRLAEVVGISASTMCALRRGANIDTNTEARVLATTPAYVRLRPPARVPTARVRPHLRRLLALPGVNPMTIAPMTDVSADAIRDLAAGKYGTVRYATAVTLLAVTPEQAREAAAYRPRRATALRVRALAANGWTAEAQAEKVGVSPRLIGDLLYHSRGDGIAGSVLASTEERVLALYNDLRDTPGPSNHARGRAAARGFRTPDWYDDDMNVVTDEGGAEHDASRFRLCVVGLTLDGLNAVQIADRLGDGHERVRKARERSGLRVGKSADGGVTIRAGQEGLVAFLRGHLEGIEHRERNDVLDAPGIDYSARWATIYSAYQERREQEKADRQAA